MIIWHVVHWHSTGMYDRLSELAEEGKAYLSVLYNLGLAVFSATILGILINRITDLLTRENIHPAGGITAEKEDGKK